MKSLKKMLTMATLLAIFCALSATAFGANSTCATIQSGTILYQPGNYMAGQPITTGMNPYGYNYQAHSFNGSFFNAYAGGSNLPAYKGDDDAYLLANPSAAGHWAWPYRTIDVAMKWNEAWLSNQDCDGDGQLDRHFGFPNYTGSGAWLTNHDSWTVTVDDKDWNADDFIKIVANPTDASYSNLTPGLFGEGTVYLNGKVLGDRIWGEFAAIQYVVNDKSTGDHGILLRSQVANGFGMFKP